MNILIIDDATERHDAFERELGSDHSLFHAFTYAEGIELLNAKVKYGLLLLDHDLFEEKNGSDVASFIGYSLDPACYPAQCIVQSWNADGAANIKSKLDTIGIPCKFMPYSLSMVKTLKNDLTAS